MTEDNLTNNSKEALKAGLSNEAPKVAVLIPCYNEELTIEKVVCDFLDELPCADIYVYDNNSKDKSVELVKKLQQEHDKGQQIHLCYETRQGKGNVVRSMFSEIDADVYLMVDADCTYDPKASHDLIAEVTEHHMDMVIGDRLSATYFEENKRPFHNFGNVLVRRLINTIFNRKKGEYITDIMTGYRAMSRDFVKTFPILSKGFEIETEMTIHALEYNFKVSSMPINYQDRPEGSSSKLNTYLDGSKVIFLIMNLFVGYRPLRFFSYVAGFFFILSCLFLVGPLCEYLNDGYVYKVPSFIACCIFLLIAVLSTFTGIILATIRVNQRRLFELNYILIKQLNSHEHKL